MSSVTNKLYHQFCIHSFNYNKKSNCLSAEVNQLPGVIGERDFEIYNIQTRKTKLFRFVSTDKCASGEDIMGWNYKSDCGIKCLIIND